MLSDLEKERLKNPGELNTGQRAKLYFNLAQKVKSRLEELKEINDILCSIPQKNANRILNEDLIAFACQLTENMLRIRGSSPIGIDQTGSPKIVRITPTLHEPGKFNLEVGDATPQEVALQFLIEDHIRVLHQSIDLNIGISPATFANQPPYSPMKDQAQSSPTPLRPLRFEGPITKPISEGADIYQKFGRKGQHPRTWHTH